MDSPSTDLPDQPVAEVPDKKSAHRLSLTRIDKRFTALFSILAKLFFIVLIVLAMVFVTRELLSQEYVIQQVSVPERFEKAGYTGPVVAQLIAQQVHDIIFASRKVEFVEEYKSSLDVNELSVDMVGLGVPIRSVIEMLGKAIGVDRKRKINTIITEEAGKIVLTVLISGGVSDRMELPLSDNSNPPMKKLISEVSEVILKHTNENVLVPYYVQVTGELDKEIELYKFYLTSISATVSTPESCMCAGAEPCWSSVKEKPRSRNLNWRLQIIQRSRLFTLLRLKWQGRTGITCGPFNW